MPVREAWSRTLATAPLERRAPEKPESPSRAAPGPVRSTPAPLPQKHSARILAGAQRTEQRSPVRTERVPERRRSHAWRWFGLGFLALAALVLGGLSFSPVRRVLDGEGAPAAPALSASAPFEHFLAAPGLVEAASGIRPLAFEVSGKLRSVAVEEGEAVRAGQVLAELENREQEARLEAAQAELGVAQAQVQVLEKDLAGQLLRAEKEAQRFQAEAAQLEAGPREEEIAVLRAEVQAAEAEERRRTEDAQKYTNPKVSTGQERDQTRRLVEIATAQLQAARAKLRQLEAGYRKEELEKGRALRDGALAEVERCRTTREPRLRAARAQAARAVAQVKLAQAELGKTRLEAPLEGVVVWKYRHAGEAVGVLPPDVVVALADCTQLRVRADVDEADFARIAEGQRVKISAEALGGKYLEGKVARLSHAAGQKRFSTGEARERMDVKVVETLIRFDRPVPLKLGLRVTAYFELAAR